MAKRSVGRREFLRMSALAAGAAGLAACGATPTPTPVVVEKVVEKPVEKIVEKQVTQVVEKPVTQVVEKVVEKVITPTPVPPASKKGGTFVMALTGDPINLNGIIGNDGTSLPVICLTQEPLSLGGENWGAAVEPNLAEKWDVSPDAKTWTWYLRKDVKWQDGKPFTADDVIFTFTKIQDPTVPATTFRSRFMEGDKPIPFTKVDDYTVRATLTQPNVSFNILITVPIIPKHILEGQDLSKTSFNQKPVGLGAFKLVEWKSGESVTLEANPTYYRGAPYLDKWVYRIIPGQDPQSIALQAGEIDFAELRGKDVPKFLGRKDFTVVTAPADRARFIGVNQAKPFFKDKRVRQALSMVIDRQAVIDAAEQGYGVPMDSVYNEEVNIYKAGKLKLPKVDFDKANALMKEAGWVDTNGDGIVEKDGLAFKITLEYNPGWTFMAPVAALIQAWWKKIGVDVTIRTYDAASFIQKVFYTTDLEKPYDAFLNGHGLYGSDPVKYSGMFAPATQGASYYNYWNPEVKAILDKAKVTVDQTERNKLYEQAEALMWDDLPYIPMYYARKVYIYNNKISLDEGILDATRMPPFRYPYKVYIKK